MALFAMLLGYLLLPISAPLYLLQERAAIRRAQREYAMRSELAP